jgi:SAM-dependent methyltransferase
MKNTHLWHSTKYVFSKGKLKGSRNTAELNVASRLQGDLVAEFYQRYLKEHASGKLVDLGCGKVPLYEAYKPFVTEVTCVDWGGSPHATIHLDITCNLNEPLPFADHSFDTVILSDVLEHISEPQLLVSEIARILTPGGKLFMNVPFYYKIHEAPYDYFRYTEFALTYLFQKAGLDILVLSATGGSPVVFTDFLAKNFIKIPLLGPLMAIVSQAMCSWFIHTILGKKFSTKTAKHFPFGYYAIVQKKLSIV